MGGRDDLAMVRSSEWKDQHARRIGPAAYEVLAVIASKADDDGSAWLSLGTIAALCKLREGDVVDAIEDRLLRLGYLKRTREFRGYSRLYKLRLDKAESQYRRWRGEIRKDAKALVASLRERGCSLRLPDIESELDLARVGLCNVAPRLYEELTAPEWEEIERVLREEEAL